MMPMILVLDIRSRPFQWNSSSDVPRRTPGRSFPSFKRTSKKVPDAGLQGAKRRPDGALQPLSRQRSSEGLFKTAVVALIANFFALCLHARLYSEGTAQGCPGGVIDAVTGRGGRFGPVDVPSVRSAALGAGLGRAFLKKTHMNTS